MDNIQTATLVGRRSLPLGRELERSNKKAIIDIWQSRFAAAKEDIRKLELENKQLRQELADLKSKLNDTE